MRFAEQFDFTIEASPETQSLLMLKLLLQPLAKTRLRMASSRARIRVRCRFRRAAAVRDVGN